MLLYSCSVQLYFYFIGALICIRNCTVSYSCTSRGTKFSRSTVPKFRYRHGKKMKKKS
jgi:hypothetical protein